MKSRLILAVGAALLGLGAVIIFAFAQPYALHGSLIEPPRVAPSIILPASDGSIFQLGEQQGKVVLLFFGYTSCPDVCPATLSEMRQVVKGLKDRAQSVQMVFITVDPQRDTTERLALYLSGFGPSFVGLSGTMDQLDPVWSAYGVYHQVQPVGESGNYTVDHTAFIYVIDKDNRLRMTYPFGTDANLILKDVEFLVKEG